MKKNSSTTSYSTIRQTNAEVDYRLTQNAKDFLGIGYTWIDFFIRCNLVISVILLSTFLFYVAERFSEWLNLSYLLGSFLILIIWIGFFILLTFTLFWMIHTTVLNKHKTDLLITDWNDERMIQAEKQLNQMKHELLRDISSLSSTLRNGGSTSGPTI